MDFELHSGPNMTKTQSHIIEVLLFKNTQMICHELFADLHLKSQIDKSDQCETNLDSMSDPGVFCAHASTCMSKVCHLVSFWLKGIHTATSRVTSLMTLVIIDNRVCFALTFALVHMETTLISSVHLKYNL